MSKNAKHQIIDFDGSTEDVEKYILMNTKWYFKRTVKKLVKLGIKKSTNKDWVVSKMV